MCVEESITGLNASPGRLSNLTVPVTVEATFSVAIRSLNRERPLGLPSICFVPLAVLVYKALCPLTHKYVPPAHQEAVRLEALAGLLVRPPSHCSSQTRTPASQSSSVGLANPHLSRVATLVSRASTRLWEG